MKSPESITAARHQLFLNYKIWLANMTGAGIISETTWELLKYIEESGSIKAAAKKANISYRKAWGDLKSTEELLSYPLIVKFRGGQDGGKTILTQKAQKLLEAYNAMHSSLDESVEKAFAEFREKLIPNNES